MIFINIYINLISFVFFLFDSHIMDFLSICTQNGPKEEEIMFHLLGYWGLQLNSSLKVGME